MKLSGFTFVRNATKFYYPVKQSILSILDIVDEYVVALGNNDPDDFTLREIESIHSSKIKIIPTVWDLDKYPHGTEHAHQTDIAKESCSGHWLFYMQSDEAIHERYLQKVMDSCNKYLDDNRVEGFLFYYKHFWGDYFHYQDSHAWYPREIRIIRNKPEIHSWNDAQSFRKIIDFDGMSYREKKGTEKLQVVQLDACISHYGWVRPPELMQKKRKEFTRIYRGEKASDLEHANEITQFDYGSLRNLKIYNDTHPAVMKEWISRFDWKDKLQFTGKSASTIHKHDKLKYRLLTFLEKKMLRGHSIGGFKNYKIIKP